MESSMSITQNHFLQTESLRLEGLRHILRVRYMTAIVVTKPSDRGLFLLASLLKLREQARAVSLLASEGMVEEVLGISRTMAEVAVNAAYLQFAETEELERFRNFDTQSMYKHASKLVPRMSQKIPDELRSNAE